MTPVDQQPPIARFFNDYTEALVHVLWAVQPEPSTGKPRRCLLFGMVEAYPRELTELPVTSEQGTKFKGSQRLFYIRQRMAIQDALALYLEGIKTDALSMRWESTPLGSDYKLIETGPLIGTSRWPNLLLADHARLPCIAPAWGMARVYSLFRSQNENLVSAWQYAGPAEWIEARLLFDLFAEDALLLGSLHLILPNPIYRRMHERLEPGDAGAVDQVRIGFQAREAQDSALLEQLALVHWEDRHMGSAAQVISPIGANPVVLSLSGLAEKTSALVVCRERGLLDGHAPAGFLRRIQVTGSLLEGVQRTLLRDGKTGDAALETQRYSTFSEREIGDSCADQVPERELGERLIHLRKRQRVREEAQRYEQHFCETEQEAKHFVRTLLQRAQRRLIIIDPYFDDLTLVAFATQTTRVSLAVRILTWAETLKQAAATQRDDDGTGTSDSGRAGPTRDEAINPVRVWERLRDELTRLNGLLDHAITVDVMTGKSAVFHDRFLVIDESVWFSGNSLNTIGRRHGMILKIPDPQPVLDALAKLDQQGQRVKSFADWVRPREASRS